MVLRNNKGSTLIENVLAVFLLSIFCIMAFTTIIARVNTLQSLTAMEQEINTAYSELEATSYSSEGGSETLAEGWSDTNEGDVILSFKVNDTNSNDNTYEVGVTYITDSEGIIGEIKS